MSVGLGLNIGIGIGIDPPPQPTLMGAPGSIVLTGNGANFGIGMASAAGSLILSGHAATLAYGHIADWNADDYNGSAGTWTDRQSGWVLSTGGANKPTLDTSQFSGLNSVKFASASTQWLTNSTTAALYQLANGTNPDITIVWQIIHATVPNPSAVWSFCKESGASADRFEMDTNGGSANYTMNDNGDSGSGSQAWSSLPSLTGGNSVFALVQRGATQTLYANGTANSTVGAVSAAARTGTTRFNIGAFSSGGSFPLNAFIRRLRIYPGAISAAQAADISTAWTGT